MPGAAAPPYALRFRNPCKESHDGPHQRSPRAYGSDRRRRRPCRHVDKVEHHRIKLTKADSGEGAHEGHHHYVPLGLVAEVEGDKVRLSATGANAITFETEESEES